MSSNEEFYKVIGMTEDHMLIVKDKNNNYYGLTNIMPKKVKLSKDDLVEEVEINFNCIIN
jgi:hypothetical protein